MEWVAALHGQIVGLDTAPLIYFIEKYPTYLDIVRPFFQAISRGEVKAVTSVVTLIEVLVHPLRCGDAGLAERYRDLLLNAEGLTTVAFSTEAAQEAARLRAIHNLRTPDAIQIATALCAGASCLLTNDARLAAVRDLRVLVLDELRGENPLQ